MRCDQVAQCSRNQWNSTTTDFAGWKKRVCRSIFLQEEDLSCSFVKFSKEQKHLWVCDSWSGSIGSQTWVESHHPQWYKHEWNPTTTDFSGWKKMICSSIFLQEEGLVGWFVKFYEEQKHFWVFDSWYGLKWLISTHKSAPPIPHMRQTDLCAPPTPDTLWQTPWQTSPGDLQVGYPVGCVLLNSGFWCTQSYFNSEFEPYPQREGATIHTTSDHTASETNGHKSRICNLNVLVVFRFVPHCCGSLETCSAHSLGSTRPAQHSWSTKGSGAAMGETGNDSWELVWCAKEVRRVAGVVWGKTDLGPDDLGSLELVGFAWRPLNEKRQRIASGFRQIFGGHDTPSAGYLVLVRRLACVSPFSRILYNRALSFLLNLTVLVSGWEVWQGVEMNGWWPTYRPSLVFVGTVMLLSMLPTPGVCFFPVIFTCWVAWWCRLSQKQHHRFCVLAFISSVMFSDPQGHFCAPILCFEGTQTHPCRCHFFTTFGSVVWHPSGLPHSPSP